jgi:putative molybdopterin biosynthesis protein
VIKLTSHEPLPIPGFLPLQEEHYDFILPRARAERPVVRRFVELLEDKEVRLALAELRFSR